MAMRKRILATVLLISTALPIQAANIDAKNGVIRINGKIQLNDLLALEVETDGINKPMVVSLNSDVEHSYRQFALAP